MGLYQKREHYERATAFGHYDAPAKFPQDSPYRGYDSTGFGMKYRMHPLAAVLGREQLKVLDKRNAAVRAWVRKVNDRRLQLPGLSEPKCRAEAERVYYNYDMLFIDEAKAGFSRDSAVKALVAEGVRATAGAYPEQHQFKIYSEAKWWHHPPEVPKVLAGCQQVNASCIRLPLFYADEPELTEQYLKAFEKVWARRSELAKI
jgi:perosamine synthetase